MFVIYCTTTTKLVKSECDLILITRYMQNPLPQWFTKTKYALTSIAKLSFTVEVSPATWQLLQKANEGELVCVFYTYVKFSAGNGHLS